MQVTLGTGDDFTIEAWFNTDTTGATDAALFSNWDSGNNRSILFGPNASGAGKFTFIFNTTGSGSWTTVANPAAIAGKWMHVAWVYDHSATRHYAYIDGVLQGSATGTAYNNSTANFLLGVNKGDGSGYYNGKVQDLRYYHAVKYTASGTTAGELVYTLPSTKPDILPDTPSGVAGGSKLTKITDGAVSFDGTATSKLKLADSTDFSFGSNDFTIEFYYYLKSFDGTYNIFFDCMGSNRSGIQLAIETDNDYRVEIGDGSNNWIWQLTDKDAKAGKWTHFALTRESNKIRLFEDGVQIAKQTSGTAVGDPRSSAIGGYATNDSDNYGFNGFISNFRIVNGSSVYPATDDQLNQRVFVPPTAPLTNVTNTKLLVCQSPTNHYAAVAPLVSGVNNGTVWSSSVAPGSAFRSGYPAVDAFNGVTKTSTEDCAATPQTAGQGFTFLFGGGVSFTTLQMQCDHNNGATVTANGVNITSQLSSGSLTNTTITGVTSPLTSLSVVSHNGDAGYLGSVTIDGTMLVDPIVPNGDAAVNNFNPFITDIKTVRGEETVYCTMNPLTNVQGVTLSDGNLKCNNI